MSKKIDKTLILLTCSNVADTIRTLDSYKGFADYFIVGTFFYDPKDEEDWLNYRNLQCARLRFSFDALFKAGFASVFNTCASVALTDVVFLTGVGNDLVEVRKEPSPIYNSWGYLRNSDLQHCHTFYNRKSNHLQWCIHEELFSRSNFDPEIHFIVNEVSKQPNPRYDMVREAVYYEQFRKVLDGEGEVNPDWRGWIFKNENHIRQTIKQNEVYNYFRAGINPFAEGTGFNRHSLEEISGISSLN